MIAMLTALDVAHQVRLVDDSEYLQGYHYALQMRDKLTFLFNSEQLIEMADAFGRVEGSRALGFRHAIYEMVNGLIGGIKNGKCVS